MKLSGNADLEQFESANIDSDFIRIDSDFIRAREFAILISNPEIRDKVLKVVNHRDVQRGLTLLSKAQPDVHAAVVLLSEINTQVEDGQRCYDKLEQAISKAQAQIDMKISKFYDRNLGMTDEERELALFKKFGDFERFSKYVDEQIGPPDSDRSMALKNPRLFYTLLDARKDAIVKYCEMGFPQAARAHLERIPKESYLEVLRASLEKKIQDIVLIEECSHPKKILGQIQETVKRVSLVVGIGLVPLMPMAVIEAAKMTVEMLPTKESVLWSSKKINYPDDDIDPSSVQYRPDASLLQTEGFSRQVQIALKSVGCPDCHDEDTKGYAHYGGDLDRFSGEQIFQILWEYKTSHDPSAPLMKGVARWLSAEQIQDAANLWAKRNPEKIDVDWLDTSTPLIREGAKLHEKGSCHGCHEASDLARKSPEVIRTTLEKFAEDASEKDRKTANKISEKMADEVSLTSGQIDALTEFYSAYPTPPVQPKEISWLCGSICHEMKESLVQEYLKSPHASKAVCGDCHASSSLGNKFSTGIKHITTNWWGTYDVEGSFEAARPKLADQVQETMIEEDSRTCQTSSCHAEENTDIMMELSERRGIAVTGNETCVSCHHGTGHKDPRQSK